MTGFATVPALFRDRAARWGDRVAFRELATAGAAADRAFTWRDWGEAVDAFAAALVATGHEPGDVVAIWADNRPVWPIGDLGAIRARGVGVGLYPTSAPVQVRHVLRDAGARTVVVDTPERLETVRALADELPRLDRVVVAGDAIDGDTVSASNLPVIGWTDWLALGGRALESGGVGAELERRAAAASPEEVAILIYTSGSTGEPKGARIPHRYLLASAASIRDALGFTEDDTTLSFLPYCHAAERVFGLYTRVLCGVECALVPDHRRVWDVALEYGPTLFGGLPRFYEKVYESLEADRAGASGPERERWDRALELGKRRSRARRDRAPETDGADTERTDALEREWDAVATPFRDRLTAHFGGRLRLATSGGAALPVEVAETLDALGLTVLGAYGLTEHLCAVFNRPDRYSFDTAGPPMPGTKLRLADDGEILIRRSDLTFAGYHDRPDATRAAFTDGGDWLRTGDLGELDDRGFLRITGRKKELIALSTGKKVAPVPIEAWLAEEPWIAQAVLYGEGRKFVSALLTLRRPVVEAWAREAVPEAPFPALVERPEVRERVVEAVERVNARLSRSERVRNFVVLDRELSLEEDELTPTMKVRRGVVLDRFRDRLEALYR